MEKKRINIIKDEKKYIFTSTVWVLCRKDQKASYYDWKITAYFIFTTVEWLFKDAIQAFVKYRQWLYWGNTDG